MRNRPIAGKYLRDMHVSKAMRSGQIAQGIASGSWSRKEGFAKGNVRLYWVAQSIQEILNLARLLPDRIERTRVVVGITAAGTPK